MRRPLGLRSGAIPSLTAAPDEAAVSCRRGVDESSPKSRRRTASCRGDLAFIRGRLDRPVPAKGGVRRFRLAGGHRTDTVPDDTRPAPGRRCRQARPRHGRRRRKGQQGRHQSRKRGSCGGKARRQGSLRAVMTCWDLQRPNARVTRPGMPPHPPRSAQHTGSESRARHRGRSQAARPGSGAPGSSS